MPVKWSIEHKNFIKSEYPGRTRKELLELFNNRFKTDRTLNQIVAFVKNNKIKSGLTGHFKKGVPSWSSGTKGLLKPNSGSFKKGAPPANLNDFGHERTCSKDGYILIKVNQVNPYTGRRGWYRLKHIVIWEKEHGAIPDGMNLRFIDGNKLNVEIENLELVSKALNLQLNKNDANSAPKEIKPTIRAISELEVKTFERKKA